MQIELTNAGVAAVSAAADAHPHLCSKSVTRSRLEDVRVGRSAAILYMSWGLSVRFIAHFEH
jgi:uncharacterized protein YwbE